MSIIDPFYVSNVRGPMLILRILGPSRSSPIKRKPGLGQMGLFSGYLDQIDADRTVIVRTSVLRGQFRSEPIVRCFDFVLCHLSDFWISF